MRSLTVTWFVWYMSVLLAVLAVMASLISYHPDVRWMGAVLPPAFTACSLVGCGMAVFLGRLPASHWVHRSQPLKVGMASAAVAVTLLLALVG